MTEPRVILLAGGGHGSVVVDALRAAGVAVAGVVDPAVTDVLGLPRLGDDAWLDTQPKEGILLVNGAGAVPGRGLRERLYAARKAQGFRFVAVRHPSAVVGSACVLAEGSQLMAGCVLQCRVRVGENAVVNTRASVDHDCTIGAHAFVGPGATLCGEVRLGEGAFIGAGAVLLPGVQVGAGAVVAAGALVLRDVAPNAWVGGHPAVPLKNKSE
jgi:sugar O-acyltransferase (sialic acid O-acetyltransferase NeuD family)